MSNNNSVLQLSYQLLHLTRQDLDVLTCLLGLHPTLDLNGLCMSLFYLGDEHCLDKSKVFLNAPIAHDVDLRLDKPVRMRLQKDVNSKLFNKVKRSPQGKLRRQYITALLHSGITTFIELSYLYHYFKNIADSSSLLDIESYLLRFGLQSLVQDYSVTSISTFKFDISKLLIKYSQLLEDKEFLSTTGSNAYSIPKEKKVMQTLDIDDRNAVKTTPLSPDTDKGRLTANQPNIKAQQSGHKSSDSKEEIKESKPPIDTNTVPTNNGNWLLDAFDPNLL
ncbi:TPA: hypothetical protein MW242_001907 [Acinetobacter baumannii]|nr:hypothetical protein [Acinetobacter baumannii]